MDTTTLMELLKKYGADMQGMGYLFLSKQKSPGKQKIPNLRFTVRQGTYVLL